MEKIIIAAFYKFIDNQSKEKFDNETLVSFQKNLLSFCQENNIMGTILLANEGINGTIAGRSESIENVVEYIKSQATFADLSCKFSVSESVPFRKLKVLIKNEIVTFGMKQLDPHKTTGVKLSPYEWNQLIGPKNGENEVNTRNEEKVTIIDTRNEYEIELGTFKNALNPRTQQFTEFPIFIENALANNTLDKKSKIALFCTGGIRCEKASSYLLENGFESVYQLEGGILRYLEQMDEKDSLWEGECFIFDNRVTLKKESIIKERD